MDSDWLKDTRWKGEKVPPEKLREILEAHEKFLSSDGSEGERADLSGARLYRAELSRATLDEADFSGATLSRADLSEANLAEVNLNKANLIGADLNRADLGRANLNGADLSKADLSEAKLNKAKLRRADMSGADLAEADLSGANMDQADMSEANMSKARLTGTELNYGNLSWVNLRDTDLTGASLYRTDLRRADLLRAELTGANLIYSKLSGARLDEAIFLRANLTNSVLAEGPPPEKDQAELDQEGTEEQNQSDTKPEDLPDATVAGASFGMANLTGAKLPASLNEFRDALKSVEDTSRNARSLFFGVLGLCAYALLAAATTTDGQLILNIIKLKLPFIAAEVSVLLFFIAAPVLTLLLFTYFLFYLAHLCELMAELPAVFPDGLPLRRKVYPWMLNLAVEWWQRAEPDEKQENENRKDPPAGIKRVREWIKSLFNFERNQAWFAVFLAWGLLPLTVAIMAYRFLVRRDIILSGVFLALVVIATLFSSIFYERARAALRSEKTDGRLRRPRKIAVYFFFIGGLTTVLGFWGLLPLTTPNIQLKGANFERKVFGEVNLTGANLSFAKPKGADIRGATLEEVDLYRADLMQADLSTLEKPAKMRGANLRNADLAEAVLRSADLTGANLFRAKLNEAYLWKANSRNTILIETELKNTFLVGVNMNSANMRNAKLNGANLNLAKLKEANLSGAKLNGANLSFADLTGAKLNNADLTGASFLGAEGLTKPQIKSACADKTVLLPKRPKGSKLPDLKQPPKCPKKNNNHLQPPTIHRAFFATMKPSTRDAAGAGITAVR